MNSGKYFALGIFICFASIILPAKAFTNEATYALIVNKNLFSPKRTAWFKNEARKANQSISKNVPRIDDKKLQLLGTVVTAKYRRALISTSSGSSRKDTEMYATGDYLQGYLVKEIVPKKVVLVNQDMHEECILFLKADKPHRSQEKTPLPQSPPPDAGRHRSRIKAETTQDLAERMKTARNILKQRDSDLVRKQVDRDYRKLQQYFGTMPEQQVQEIILMKKEIDKMQASRK